MPRIFELHGLLATKMQSSPQGYGMHVEVRDGRQMVLLVVNHASCPAGLTSDEARILAQQLIDAANRLDAHHAALEARGEEARPPP
jgi:hypothetical protein